MTRRGWCGAGIAMAISAGLHAGGVMTLAPEEPQTLAGGPQQSAMIGNSFEDAVSGTVTGVTDPLPSTSAAPIATAAMPVRPAPISASSPAPHAAPILPTGALVPASPVRPAATPERPSPVRPTLPPAAIVSDIDTVTARDAPVVQTPTADTIRPQPRIERPISNAPPQPDPPEQPRQPAPSPEGNAPETTQAGATAGSPQGQAAQTRAGEAGQAASDERAAAQYPQLVNRHLSRLRRPNTRFDGAAVIAFTIAANGGLVGLSVAQSSGNADFDSLAIAYVQRAAPFPAPPAGAQRSFNVTVRGR